MEQNEEKDTGKEKRKGRVVKGTLMKQNKMRNTYWRREEKRKGGRGKVAKVEHVERKHVREEKRKGRDVKGILMK